MNPLAARIRSRSALRHAALGPAAVVILLACSAPGSADAADRLRLGLGFTAWHSDNLLQYSVDQIRTFDSGSSPQRFSIETIGDGVYSPSIFLSWESTRPDGRGREIRLRGSGEFHLKNGTADFRAVSLRWREAFGRERRLTLGGYYLPSFYLRQLYDEDYVPLPGMTHYRRADFGLGIGSIAWRERLARRLRGEAEYQYEHRGYNSEFEERTSNTHQGTLSLEWHRLPRRGIIEVWGGYRKSLGRADDGDLIANDDPDVSYHGLLAGASGRIDFTRRRVRRLSGRLDYEYATRRSESDLASDTAHFRRNDHRHTVQASLQCALPPDVTARAFYRLESNAARFPAGAGPSGDPASYTENQVGLAIDWSTVLWRSERIPSAPADDAP